MNFDIDFSEVEALAERIAAAPEQALKGARRLVVANVGQIGQSMARNIPVGPGRYGVHTADSVTYDARARSEQGQPFAEAGPEHFVARFLEYGTVKMPPQPFVDESTDENLPGIDADFANLLEEW